MTSSLSCNLTRKHQQGGFQLTTSAWVCIPVCDGARSGSARWALNPHHQPSTAHTLTRSQFVKWWEKLQLSHLFFIKRSQAASHTHTCTHTSVMEACIFYQMTYMGITDLITTEVRKIVGGIGLEDLSSFRRSDQLQDPFCALIGCCDLFSDSQLEVSFSSSSTMVRNHKPLVCCCHCIFKKLNNYREATQE